jgi:hypothetical protein
MNRIEPNLKLARSIVTSFLVNVKKNPEYLRQSEKWTSQTCDRNMKVAVCMEAIDDLINSL